MPESNVIEAVIRARPAEYIAGLQQSATATRDAAREMQSELSGIGNSAREAHQPLSGFADIIKHYRTEVRQEGRYARFLAADIASMGIASKGAASEVTMLVSAFAFGGGFGLAVESVKMLVKEITSAAEESEKAAARIKGAHNEIFRAATEAMLAVQASLHGSADKTTEAWDKTVQEFKKKKADLQTEIDQLRGDPGTLKRFWSDLGPSDELMAKYKEMAALVAGLNDAKSIRQVTANDERAQQTADIARHVQVIEAGTADEIARLNVELVTKLSELNKRRDQDTEQHGKIREALEADTAERVRRVNEDRDLALARRELELDAQVAGEEQRIQIETSLRLAEMRVRLRRATDEMEQARIREGINAESEAATRKIELIREIAEAKKRADDASQESERNLLVIETRQEEQARKHKAELEKLTHNSLAFAATLQHAFGSAFRSMLDGSKDFGAAVTDMMKSLTVSIVDGMVKMGAEYVAALILGATSAKAAALSETSGNIAVAISGAAASQAAIPIIGPELAMASATGMEAFLAGVTGPLLSASGGLGRVPRSEMPILVHEGESVIPEPLAEAYRRGAESLNGGGGGGNINVYAMDSQSFEEFLRRNGTAVVKTLHRLNRDGRL